MSHKVAIMQPYIFPYIGYFQLISKVDDFVLYDDIKYTKKGWINRNRLLGQNGPMPFTIPIKSNSDSAHIRERQVSEEFVPDKLLRRFEGAYAKAPHFNATMELIELTINMPSDNLFEFIFDALNLTCKHIGLETNILVSSEIADLSTFRGEARVIETCSNLYASQYVNPLNGKELYDSDNFAKRGIELSFLVPRLRPYDQQRPRFTEGLSIIDVLMFNSIDVVRETFLDDGEIIGA